ncbi:MAG: MFS transporter, partial [Candidatus Binatia bacterium]
MRGSGAAWRTLVGCLVCQMGLGLGAYIFAVFLKPIVAELSWTRTTFSLSTLPLLVAMSLGSPLVGALTERRGARFVFSAAITLVSVALLLFSYMQSLWQFYSIGFLLGIGATGLGDIPAGAVVSRWFERHRGLALGLVYVGSNIGGSVVPIVATAIAEESSWRVALRLLAVGGWIVILPCALWLVRERPVTEEERERSSVEPQPGGEDLD